MRPQSGVGRRPAILVLIAVTAIAIIGAAGIWYLFFRPAGPAPVSLGTLPPSSVVPGASAIADDPTGAVDGTWTVDDSIGSIADGSGTFVGYRVQEQLATIGATEAVGRTSSVSGSMTVQGTTVTTAELTADLTTLRSDESNRDRQLSRQALETSQYPTATFSLTQPIDLGSVPADGAVIDITATGDLTLHGVTRSVDVPLQARIDGGVVTVAGSLPITFSDWSIEAPRAMVVLSVADQGMLELQLHFTRPA